MKLLAKNIRRFRTMRRLTQAQVGERAGLEPSAINHFESGRREPSIGNLVKLCKALRVNPSQLIGGFGGESIYDSMTHEEIDFINLVRDAVIRRHKRDIKERKRIEAKSNQGE